jgi:DNA-binding transcriptional ArsR family regulator
MLELLPVVFSFPRGGGQPHGGGAVPFPGGADRFAGRVESFPGCGQGAVEEWELWPAAAIERLPGEKIASPPTARIAPTPNMAIIVPHPCRFIILAPRGGQGGRRVKPIFREAPGISPESLREIPLVGHGEPPTELVRCRRKGDTAPHLGPAQRFSVDDVERLLWWLFQSSSGAPTRVKVVRAIRARPRNAQQIADELGMDYTTIRHHLNVLASNHLIETVGERYGQVYFLSSSLESRWPAMEAIAARRTRARGGAS